jgi:hypothetical protein
MNIFGIILLIYFLVSTTYAVLVFKNVYKDSTSFLLNILFGPFALIYNIWLLSRNKNERIF